MACVKHVSNLRFSGRRALYPYMEVHLRVTASLIHVNNDDVARGQMLKNMFFFLK
jgi:UDP-galactopyranose mutase